MVIRSRKPKEGNATQWPKGTGPPKIMVHKVLGRRLNIEQNEDYWKPRVNSGASEE